MLKSSVWVGTHNHFLIDRVVKKTQRFVEKEMEASHPPIVDRCIHRDLHWFLIKWVNLSRISLKAGSSTRLRSIFLMA